jgi:hypothetical protein
MLQRLLGHTALMMTNRYCQAVGCYDACELIGNIVSLTDYNSSCFIYVNFQLE